MADTKTDLQILKDSLRIPSEINDDDVYLQTCLDSALEYLKNTVDDETVLNTQRAKMVQLAIAELMYNNRGNEKAVNDFPYTLRVMINSLRY